MKRRNFGILTALLSGTALIAPIQADLVRNPTSVGASFDIGQIVQGTIYDGSNVLSKYDGDKQQITRTGVYLTESGTYNDRLSIYLTVGGLFWYTQTATFHENLRSTVYKLVGNNLNAKLYIGEINGSILRGFTIDTVIMYFDNQPFVEAGQVAIRYHP